MGMPVTHMMWSSRLSTPHKQWYRAVSMSYNFMRRWSGNMLAVLQQPDLLCVDGSGIVFVDVST